VQTTHNARKLDRIPWLYHRHLGGRAGVNRKNLTTTLTKFLREEVQQQGGQCAAHFGQCHCHSSPTLT
jgi:hypothetical protein